MTIPRWEGAILTPKKEKAPGQGAFECVSNGRLKMVCGL
jgi:hypothetical protein